MKVLRNLAEDTHTHVLYVFVFVGFLKLVFRATVLKSVLLPLRM